jgi:TRAP-type C4-dicarboxylate transport system permease small subunit
MDPMWKSIIRWSITVDIFLLLCKLVGQIITQIVAFIASLPWKMIAFVTRKSYDSKNAVSIGKAVATPLTKLGGLIKYALIIEGIILAIFIIIVILQKLKRKSVSKGISSEVQQECAEQTVVVSKDMDEF